MGDVPFHATAMGRRFFEATLPALVQALERLNTNIERLASRPDAALPTPKPQPGTTAPTGTDR